MSHIFQKRFLRIHNFDIHQLIKQILKCPVGTLDLGLLRRCGVDGGVAGGTFAPGTPHSKEVAFWNVDGIWLGKTDNPNRDPPEKKKEMQPCSYLPMIYLYNLGK